MKQKTEEPEDEFPLSGEGWDSEDIWVSGRTPKEKLLRLEGLSIFEIADLVWGFRKKP